MGLGNVLFGRKKLKGPARDRLFALTTAAVTLDVSCGLKPAGVGAIVFKPLSAGEFTQVDNDVEQLLQGVAAGSGSKLDRKKDTFGFEWVIVRDPELEDQVTASTRSRRSSTSAASAASCSQPCSASRAASIRSTGSTASRPGTFWPFVPTGEKQERDNARELELKAKLEKELPVEQDLTKWFALFDAPI